MRVWLITVGEPLPIDGNQVRLLRTGLFAQKLSDSGHQVHWWTSDFDHYRKKARFSKYHVLSMDPNYKIHLLSSVAYYRNISVRRLINHHFIAKQFLEKASRVDRPDVIVCSMPTIELTEAAAKWAQQNGVPMITDIRDLWPDIYFQFLPEVARGPAKKALGYYYHQLERGLRASTSIVATSDSYLRWGLAQCRRQANRLDRVFPLGYEKPKISSTELSEEVTHLRSLGVDPSKTICWFAGIFGRSYDLKTIIEAARVLHEQGYQSIQFVLSGDGDQRESMQLLAKSIPSVVFTGWLSGQTLSAMAELAQIGMASYVQKALQSLPNKIFEYLASELAIVSSLESEVQQILSENHCGITYQAQNPDSLAKTLKSLIENPSRIREMASNGVRLYEQKFRASSIYRNLQGYLEEISDRSPSH